MTRRSPVSTTTPTSDVYVCMLADGVALRNRCPQGQADPRAAIAGGSGSASPSMRWADVYVPHVSPAWGPCAADGRPLRDAALVLEDDPGPATPSVFFTAGQRVVTQCRIAVSFRSFARLAGRCSVQSSAPKRRQTCPG